MFSPAYLIYAPFNKSGGEKIMNSFIAWIGGKKLLRKAIIERFPESFDRYIEVFGGAGWVLFGKKSEKS